MTQCKLSAQEFIQNSFSPVVGVLCSPSVDEICRKNNLLFVELLQPFCKLNVEAQLRDPSGSTIPVRNLHLNIVDVNGRPPDLALARKLLNSSVRMCGIGTGPGAISTTPTPTPASTPTDNVYEISDEDIATTKSATPTPSPVRTPWFETWRDIFLQVQYPSDHEFTKHILACIIAVTSTETNPMETIQRMLQHLQYLQQTQPKLPKWFQSNILRFFVVLHDTLEGSHDNALQLMDVLKQKHDGNHCFLLQTNSRPPGSAEDHRLPDPWSQYLLRKPENIDFSTDSNNVTSLPNSFSSTAINKLEIGQEANEFPAALVTFHPLSPEVQNPSLVNQDDEVLNMPINSNVWQVCGQEQGQHQHNSVFGSTSIIHGACLTTNDVEQLKSLIHEFSLKSLLPYVEKQIQQLTDLISNKKGVSRSLFSATKRWFTPNKPGTTAAVNAIVYANDSPELQLRRLGDLYFMFGHYSMAFQVYHSVKRDFNADQAWLHYAGALEMAALAAFMCGEMTRKTCEYMEESIVTYLYTCRMPHFATRATLLSTECLKAKGQFGEAAHQFIRMTSEDSDLRSALFLEQAAYCFLQCHKPPMARKYAFHIVLAGHRFSKCSQKKHSLRCYRQAFQIYNNKGWSLAEDHIYFTIGKQAFHLKQLKEAIDAFSKLLTPTSKQNTQQQTLFLKEYLNALYQQQLKEKGDKKKIFRLLSLPLLNSDETKVLLGPQLPLSTPGKVPASGVTFHVDINDSIYKKWNKLEEMMVQEANGSVPIAFKPLITFFSNKNSTNVKPIAVVGEPIQVSVTFHNTLQLILPLKDIYLLWTFSIPNVGKTDNITKTAFEHNTCEVISNECADKDDMNSVTNLCIRTHYVTSVNLAPNCKEELVLSLTPLTVGELRIQSVAYTLSNNIIPDGITGKQEFRFERDKRLEISIAPSGPSLQISFSEMPQELLCNELQNVAVELRNCGSTALHKVMMSSSLPSLFSLEHTQSNTNKNYVIPITFPPNFNGRLEPGQSHVMHVWFRAPPTKGTSIVDLLFYYESVDTHSIPRYRLVRHFWNLSVQDSLETEVITRHSCNSNNVETLLLSLCATNRNQLHHAVMSEITLLRTALISYNWTLSKDTIIQKDVKLQSEESAHLLLKVKRFINNKHFLNYSEESLSTNKKMNATAANNEQTYVDFAKKSISSEIDLFEMSTTAVKKNSLHDIEAMLMLGWQALVQDSAGNKRIVLGQNYIPIEEKPQKQSIVEVALPTTFVQNQIVSTVAHPSVLIHDFIENNICIVPIILTLHSCMDSDLVIKINTRENVNRLGTKSQKSQNFQFDLNFDTDCEMNINSSNYFRWMGRREYVCSMEPFSSCQVALNVAVLAPGTYDVGGYIEILCRLPNQPYNPVLQNSLCHSPFIVH